MCETSGVSEVNVALLVIDMQNDYLYEKRKKSFPYATEELTARVNELVGDYAGNGCDVIYIRHLIQNLPTNRLLFGYSLAGTEGAELYRGLDVVSDLRFDKYFSDALSNKELLELVRAKGYDELHLCGLDEYGCVASTAIGAKERGIEAKIVRRATATVLSDKKVRKARSKLSESGVQYI